MTGLKAFYTQNRLSVAYVLLFPVLWLLSLVFALCVFLRRFLYRIGLLKGYLPKKAKVISVGNITLGGSGKTPLVQYLAKFFVRKGYSVVVLMRGYKAVDHLKMGDEASMLQKNLGPDVLVLVGGNRCARAKQLERENFSGIILLDDGFQHWRLRRHFDIVTIDVLNPFGRNLLLPAGQLREGLGSLDRADVFCLTHTDDVGGEQIKQVEAILRKKNPDALLIHSFHKPELLWRLSDKKTFSLNYLENKKVYLLCGIAQPKSFLGTINKLKPQQVVKKFFEDHHPYTSEEILSIVEDCKKRGLDCVVTTQKDAQRLEGLIHFFPEEIEVIVLNIELDVMRGKEVFYDRLSVLCRF